MAGDYLNLVVAKITISGEEQKFVYLKLHQVYNGHHRFTIIVNYLSPGNTFQQTPEKFINYVGETASIVFTHKKTGESNEFDGIITSVEMIGSEGEHGGVAIHGMSPTILYDNNRTLNSWMDKDLKTIIKDVTKDYGNVPLVCEPKFAETIPYMSQYNESVFGFLNRMSQQYGEWFYYDGANVFFGNPGKNDAEKLVYDLDLEEVRLIANLIPGKYDKYDYVAKENKPYSASAPDSVDGMDDFLTQAQKRSDQYYAPSSLLSANPHIMNKTELDTQLEITKTMATSQMINVKGISKTCRVKIGNVVDISFPASMKLPPLGRYRITEVVHEVHRDGHYSNSFLGIAAGIKYIPVPDMPTPLAMPELATVFDNKDEENQGRVKVCFDWQKEGVTTNWIRVQSPDAGTSDKVSKNRGMVHIPEINDQVMVSYEHGNPDRPFVSGSMFHAESGSGGDTDNKIKSMMTRSGIGILMDDSTGSVLIVDQTGENLIVIDGKDSITISTTKTITLTNNKSSIIMEEDKMMLQAKDILIDGSNSVVIVSGKETQLTVTSADKAGIYGKGDSVVYEANKSMVLTTDKGEIAGTKLNIEGSEEINLSGGLVKINS